MKIETILNAFEIVLVNPEPMEYYPRRLRQCRAFRDRVIRMDKEKDEAYAKLDKAFDNYMKLKDADFVEMYMEALDRD